ncbi:hypothetical protein HDK90DRAFT_539793 [Phyllosticta capitalensis]|uniref:Uncharacterized protein n=1 Tax=Phyllosticta capitalensis TaxID=121624 RepID=A0ABR1Z477_9PEZI
MYSSISLPPIFIPQSFAQNSLDIRGGNTALIIPIRILTDAPSTSLTNSSNHLQGDRDSHGTSSGPLGFRQLNRLNARLLAPLGLESTYHLSTAKEIMGEPRELAHASTSDDELKRTRVKAVGFTARASQILADLKRFHANLEEFHNNTGKPLDDMRIPSPTELLESVLREDFSADMVADDISRGISCYATHEYAVSLSRLSKELAMALSNLNRRKSSVFQKIDLITPDSDDEAVMAFLAREKAIERQYMQMVHVAQMMYKEHRVNLVDLESINEWATKSPEGQQKETERAREDIESHAKRGGIVGLVCMGASINQLVRQKLTATIIQLEANSRAMWESLAILREMIPPLDDDTSDTDYPDHPEDEDDEDMDDSHDEDETDDSDDSDDENETDNIDCMD